MLETLRPNITPIDDDTVLESKLPRYPACTADLAAENPVAEPIRLVPLRDKILVELVEVRETESSIFTAATMESPTEYGRVLDVGPLVSLAQPSVPDRYRITVGAIVQFGKFSGYALEGERTMLIREADLNGLVHGGIVTSKATRAAVAGDEVRKILTTGPVSPADEARIRAPHGINPAKAYKQRRG